jgi:hypothetical protein
MLWVKVLQENGESSDSASGATRVTLLTLVPPTEFNRPLLVDDDDLIAVAWLERFTRNLGITLFFDKPPHFADIVDALSALTFNGSKLSGRNQS